MKDMLEKEFEYYLNNQNELVKKYNGKVLVIKNCVVVGSYSSEIEAIEKSSKNYEIGTFLVQKCSPGENDYTMRFNSRVSFKN
jgi:hypothetical protein